MPVTGFFVKTLFTMDDLKNKSRQVRERIALQEDWEVNWWTEKFNVSKLELEEAVSKVGNSAKAVAEFFNKK